jgi:hypothetical protein
MTHTLGSKQHFGVSVAASLLLLLTCFETESQACSCVKAPPVADAFRAAALVFVGSVESLTPGTRASYVLPLGRGSQLQWKLHKETVLTIRFTVIERFKGPQIATVDVLTDAPGSSCWFGFKEGERYLIYAYERQENPDPDPPEPLREADARLPDWLVAEVKEFNKDLSAYGTGMCTRSCGLERAGDEINEVRRIAEQGGMSRYRGGGAEHAHPPEPAHLSSCDTSSGLAPAR